MAAYYPVFLDLKGRVCVIVGGGKVAEGKVRQLLESGATVTVVSPNATASIKDLANSGSLRWHPRKFEPGDVKNAYLAIAATDRPEVNRRVAEEADAGKVLLNVVDTPELCGFIAPSVVRRGDVVFAISTGGASPALARKLRESLEASELLDYAELAPLLSKARGEVKRRGLTVAPELWQRHIDMALVRLVRQGREEEALEGLLASLAGDGAGP